MADIVCCSIETEPKTLSKGQLDQAREIAADVVENLEPEEASTLFIQGLTLVAEAKKIDLGEEVGSCKKQEIGETLCQCSVTNNTAINDSPPEIDIREPNTAPF